MSVVSAVLKSLIWFTGSKLNDFLAYSAAEDDPLTCMRMGWSVTSVPSAERSK